MGKIAYIDKDFDTLKAAMFAQVPVLAPWLTNLNEGEMAVALINLMAGTGDMLAYLLDRNADEVFLPTAIRRESVQKLVRLIDYKLSRPVAAKTTLRFALPTPAVQNVLIPRYTQVKTTDGVVFTTKTDATIFTGQSLVDVEGYQGEYVLDTATGNGQDEQLVRLTRGNIAQNFLDVRVGNVLWTEDTDTVSPTLATVYDVVTDVNEGSTLRFSRFLGAVPPQNTPLVVHAITTRGAAGNIGSGVVSKLVSTVPGAPAGLTVTNITVASGGKDRESIEQAKLNAPRRLRALGRAVSLNDYVDLLEGFPKVAKAQAIDHFGYAEVYVAPENGERFFLTAPVIAATPQTTGGTLPVGNYRVAVTALDAYGETNTWDYTQATRAVLDRGLLVTTTDATGSIDVVVTPVTGAVQYRFWLSDDAGVTWRIAATQASPNYSILAVPQTAPAVLPAVNSTGVRAQSGSQSLRQALDAYLEERRTISTVFALFNPVLVPVDITATVKVWDNYLQSDVQGRVQTALTEFFAFGKRNFGEDVALSDIYSTIVNVEGVRSVQLPAPVDDVVLGNGQLATLGAVTLTMSGGVS